MTSLPTTLRAAVGALLASTVLSFADSAPPEWVALYESPTTRAIDPFDSVSEVAVDQEGNVYSAATGEDLGGTDQIVLLKYGPAGDLIWERAFREGDRAVASNITLDPAGNIYITGTERYTLDRPGQPATGADITTIKFDPGGNLIWSARYAQPSSDGPEDLSVTDAGQVYVTGYSYNSNGDLDIVTLKYDVDGTELWVRRHDGPAQAGDRPAALALDRSGNVLVTGYTTAYCFIDDDDDEACITDMTTLKYSPGGELLWFDSFDGPTSGTDRGQALAVDRHGSIYVTGTTVTTDFVPRQVTVKYTRTGRILWTAFGEEEDNFTGPDSIVVDRRGNVYVAGGLDFSIVKYNPWGRRLWKQSLFPGLVAGMGLDRTGNVCVGGRTQDEISTAYAGAKLDPAGNLLWCGLWDRDTGGRQISRDATVDARGNIYVAGYSFGNTSGDPGAATVKFVPAIPPPLPVIEVFAADRIANEGRFGKDGRAAFVLRRRSDPDEELTVHYSIGGNATNGLDYGELSGDATFEPGQSLRWIVVQAIDDLEMETTERIELQLLTNPDAAYRIGNRSRAVAYIVDDDKRRILWPRWWQK